MNRVKSIPTLEKWNGIPNYYPDNIPLILTYAFVFVLPWRATITVIGDRTIGVAIGILMVTVFTISKFTITTLRSPDKFHVAYFVLIAWIFLSSLWSIDISTTLSQSIRPVLVAGMLIIFWDLFDTKDRIISSLKFYIAGSYVLAGMAFYEFIVGEPTVTSYGSARYVGMGAQAPNIQSFMVAMGIFAAWFVYTQSDSFRFRIACLGYIPLAIFAVFIAGSRHGFILLVLGIGYIISYVLIYRSSLLAIPIVGIGGLLTYLYSPGVTRIATIPEEILFGDLNRRVILWQEAFTVGTENLTTGLGFRTFYQIGEASPHNSFLAIFVGTGIIGVLLYTYIYLRTLQFTFNLRRDYQLFSVFILLVILGAHAAQTIPFNPIIWYFLSIIPLLWVTGNTESF